MALTVNSVAGYKRRSGLAQSFVTTDMRPNTISCSSGQLPLGGLKDTKPSRETALIAVLRRSRAQDSFMRPLYRCLAVRLVSLYRFTYVAGAVVYVCFSSGIWARLARIERPLRRRTQHLRRQ